MSMSFREPEKYPFPDNNKRRSYDSLTPLSHHQKSPYTPKSQIGPLSSGRSDGEKTRAIAIAVKAHNKLRMEPFDYALENLIEAKNCKVVVISCLSRLQDEMGIDHIIDVEAFMGISQRKMEIAINQQINNLNHFLRAFRAGLDQKGVQMDIRVSAGPKSDEILVQAARALHLHWVVLDNSFQGKHKKIQAELDCNLVLVKKPPRRPEVLRLTSHLLGPVDELHSGLSEEEPEVVLDGSSSTSPWTKSSTSQTGSQSANARGSSAHDRNGSQNEYQTSRSSQRSSKFFICKSCRRFSAGEVHDPLKKMPPPPDEGPTQNTTVLYGEIIPGARAAYLGKVGNQHHVSREAGRRPSVDSRRPSLDQNRPSFDSSNPDSPAGKSDSSSGWVFGREKTAHRRSVQQVEAELEAQMHMQSTDIDPEYTLQL